MAFEGTELGLECRPPGSRPRGLPKVPVSLFLLEEVETGSLSQDLGSSMQPGSGRGHRSSLLLLRFTRRQWGIPLNIRK